MNQQILYLLKRLTVFFLFLSLVYVILLFAFGNFFSQRYTPNLIYQTKYNYLRLKEVKQCSNVDLLFLGSSHAYRGFDTRIFETADYKVFNLGSSSQTPLQTQLLLKRYLKDLNPKLVVFEVNPMVFSSDGVESTLDLIASDYNDINSLKLVLKQKNIKGFNTYIYALKNQFFRSEPKLKLANYHQGGYVSRAEGVYFDGASQIETKIDINKKQLKAFEQILQMLKKNDINYILVQAPITKKKYKSFTNIEAFNTQMKNYGQYYNFNSMVKLIDTLDFYDSHHLNQGGVNIFNAAFLDVLENDFEHILSSNN